MGNTLEILQFQAELNTRLIKEDFEEIFSDEIFFSRFLDFLATPTGAKWMNKKNGKRYKAWQACQ